MPFVFGWLLNGIYVLILTAVAPVLVYRRLAQGKYRHGWKEKLTGQLRRQHPDRPCLWFHAVSVGEVVQLQRIIEDARQRFPSAELFITVTTDTGFEVAKSKYPNHTVSYFPLDFTWAVSAALNAIRPDAIVLVELELWPNFVFAAHRRHIPLVLINGRIGEKSFRGYSRIKWLMQQILVCFDVLAVQNETYADRLRRLGAPTERVIVTGNIKFDRVETDRSNPKTAELRRGFQLADTEQVLVAGSTQDPEESYALAAWAALRAEFPNLRLILVPRHKERFNEVAALVLDRGYPLIRRSRLSSEPGSNVNDQTQTAEPAEGMSAGRIPPVLLLDTLGDLAACWGLAEIAFVGGTLTNRGGQNMIEPAGYGAALVLGPNTWNFKDITEALVSRNAARVVHDANGLRETIRELLGRPVEANQLGQAAQSFVQSQQGAVQRTLDLIDKTLSRTTRG
ncbi:3-deoxy-D-manno-octulosonic acid transferase [Schlesneria paludicola]|uniref:3-deoxy-D-manno-octulosonic acid transferase n=1 Tax=Schlesneria paludicola TaxID=360056 RepID=UPI00029A7385|nr:3-deoxy-D-manno-octulosonic acid transferase [Schlesneria paludicola]